MLQIESREQVKAVIRRWRQDGLETALVPTMGNLHAGHLALVETARRVADRVITSIYVNPTQFGQNEDFASYPRTLEPDCALLEKAGCDAVFIPDQTTMYPFGIENPVRVLAAPDLSARLEGQLRPGHFDGVTTVVARLFNLVSPDTAVFGEKDYQQLLVIRRMVEDLGYGIRIVSVPTVREATGLALSSRNSYLGPAEKTAANGLSAVLLDAAERINSGSTDWARIEQLATDQLRRLGFRVDYFAVRRAMDLGEPNSTDPELRVLAAVWSGRVRLIDNVGANSVGFLRD
jgi:pantoate--beta-alanine ligase